MVHKLRGLFFLFVTIATLLLAAFGAGCGDDSTDIPGIGTDASVDGTAADTSTPVDSSTDDVAVDAPPTSAFNVTAAAATSATRVTVTFSAPPNPAQAAVLANYAAPGLTFSGTPTLSGNVVTLTTSVQSAIAYTLTVSNVTRASDAQALTTRAATFTGRAPFNVESAASTNSVTLTVTFDAPPTAMQATTLANYTVPGLTLSGTPTLAGSTVTLTTTAQANQSYTVTVSNVTRASDGEPLATAIADFNGTNTFNVMSAQSTSNTSMTVTFDAAPNAAEATTLAHYDVPGLTLSGTPTLAGNVVTLTTSSQAGQAYTVTVTDVTRDADGEALVTNTADFQGRTTFNVTSASSTSSTRIAVVFDAPPTAAAATNLANYDVPGLTLSAPVLAGSTVTFTTTAQAAQTYTVTVSNVTRNADGEALAVSTADFTGRTPFSVGSAQSTSAVTIEVTFDAAPNTAQATMLANYTVAGLGLSGVPTLAGNTVTIHTAGQLAQAYTVTVAGVTRASDGEPLTVATADFTGTAVQAPTVTNVVVTATVPDNGTTPYNTGTTTVTITGTDLATVDCAAAVKGVRLSDLNGIGVAVGTRATSCTVDSDTQITATFPAGIRTNGATGWDVIATNTAGSNATSTVPFVPRAGLLISEVFVGASGGTTPAQREFIEIYNPTSRSIDASAAGLNVRLRVRNSTASTDVNKTLTFVTNGVIPSHGFLLLVSTDTATTDAWYVERDATYAHGLVGDGAAYISLSGTANLLVIDKVGWGNQPEHGYEGTALANIPANQSAQRKPAGGAGHATDTDDNSADFNAPSASISPHGTVSAPQPEP
ncbi:MAG: hypothetical protein KF764_30730 [Labilithrix sp.]|nr:hypothetical protein [Labilithrix sp.]MBX3219608.1 hypothetical protein [Labilithrix sp.]